jgi:hypothetical protein
MSLTTSWVSAHDFISAIPSLCIRVRGHLCGPLRGRTRQGPCSLHRFPFARYRARRYASLARCGRPSDGVSCSCDVLVRVGGDGCTWGTDGRRCCCVVTRTFGAIRLAGMGVGNSCPLDDRLRLSYSTLVSVLAWATSHPMAATRLIGQIADKLICACFNKGFCERSSSPLGLPKILPRAAQTGASRPNAQCISRSPLEAKSRRAANSRFFKSLPKTERSHRVSQRIQNRTSYPLLAWGDHHW